MKLAHLTRNLAQGPFPGISKSRKLHNWSQFFYPWLQPNLCPTVTFGNRQLTSLVTRPLCWSLRLCLQEIWVGDYRPLTVKYRWRIHLKTIISTKRFLPFFFPKKEDTSSQRQNNVFNEHANYLVAKWTFNSDEGNTKNLIRTARERRTTTLISNSEKSLSGNLTSDPLTL